jgi:mannose-6-phosphate isomerase
VVKSCPSELLGSAPPEHGRFPLLVKILDAREKLSLQVHPPPEQAARLGGEPKSELWYIADADPGAELYVGLKRGVTRAEFEKKIKSGEVAECFHQIHVRAGDAMFLPSGRLHAIGGGLVIFEIQQNSDTTYRVFDWNRVGLDGKPRALHIKESLASINFEDFEPGLINTQFSGNGLVKVRPLVRDAAFQIEALQTEARATVPLPAEKMQIIAVVTGTARVGWEQTNLSMSAGEFCLIPAALKGAYLEAEGNCTVFCVEAGS